MARHYFERPGPESSGLGTGGRMGLLLDRAGI
jgi:hypothetical protein